MSVLCPFFKEQCKGNQCMMWKEEKCLILNFLEQGMILGEGVETPVFQRQESLDPSTLEYIDTISAEDLASEGLEFWQKKYPNDYTMQYEAFELYLQSKGLNQTWGAPADTIQKIYNARMLLNRKVEKLRIEKEKLEIPSVTDRFIDWLEGRGETQAKLNEVSRFIKENDLDLLFVTKRDIWTAAQNKLEKRYQEKVLREKSELPNLVDQCVDWARANSLNSISKVDINTFIIEKGYDITKEIQKSMYSLTNTKLKSRK